MGNVVKKLAFLSGVLVFVKLARTKWVEFLYAAHVGNVVDFIPVGTSGSFGLVSIIHHIGKYEVIPINF